LLRTQRERELSDFLSRAELQFAAVQGALDGLTRLSAKAQGGPLAELHSS
jgi:hypothetical protein